MANTDNFTHVGVCKNVPAMLKLYEKMPSLVPKLQRLVYIADADEETVKSFFNKLTNSPKEEKHKLIESFNPTWQELIPGVNVHL